MAQYLIGNVVELRFESFLRTGWVDPATVTLTIKPPSGDNEVLTPTKDAAGRYSYLWDSQGKEAGIYLYRWQGDGNYECAAEGSFELVASQVV